MLIQYRRHAETGRRKCKKGYTAYEREKKNCDCMVYVEGRPAKDTPYLKMSTGTRSWEKARQMIVEAEERGSWDAPTIVKTENGVVEVRTNDHKIDKAVDAFLDEAASVQGRNITVDTFRKYRVLLIRLKEFCQQNGWLMLGQLTIERCRAFRGTWSMGPKATANNLVRLRTFFRFCVNNGWITINPAVQIKAPKVINTQKHPFTDEEVDAMLNAAGQMDFKGMPNSEVVAFILTLRYSGLRISDATLLPLSALQNGHLHMWMQKPQAWVSIPLPSFVTAALQAVEPKQGKYFFCAGSNALGTITALWRKKLKKVYKKAGVVGAHPHRFRHTFAVNLLVAGIDITEVSTLLGHASTSVTEKHYSRWVKARQDRLTANVMAIYEPKSISA